MVLKFVEQFYSGVEELRVLQVDEMQFAPLLESDAFE